MDLYTFLLFLGVAGLATMAIQGIGGGHFGHGQGHGGHAGHGGGHAGHAGGHGGHAGHGGHSVGHAGHAASGHGHAASTGHAHSTSHGGQGFSRFAWHFASPRVLFSISLGAGAAGPLLRPLMGNGGMLAIAAIGTGIIFERAIITPLWNFAFRFASKPALMLESVVDDEATAVTAFDRNGQGLIAVDLDGQVVQMLATLKSDDRDLGAAVRAGDRVRIADVNVKRNSCTVTVL